MPKYRIKTVRLKNGSVFHYPQEKYFLFWNYFIKNQEISGDPEYFEFRFISEALEFLNKVKKDNVLNSVSESVESVSYTPYS